MGRTNFTREDIIQALNELEAEGIQPGRKSLLERKGINGYWISKLIPEGLTQLKLKHGIKISPQEQQHSNDELLEKIDEAVSHFSRIPSWAQLRRKTQLSDRFFLKRFGQKGKREVFIHYRKWLTQHRPESENIKLVDEYLEDQKETKTPAESEGRDEIQSLLIKPVSSFKSHCDHCGNETFKSRIASHSVRISDRDLVEYELYICTICEHVVLRKKSAQDVAQLWPPSLEFPPNVPEKN